MNSLYHRPKIVTFWNDGTFIRTSSVQGLPVIFKWHNLQSLDKALDRFIEFKFLCELVSLSEQEQKLYGGYL